MNYMNYLNENWKSLEFPLIQSKDGTWSRRNATLSNLKNLFKDEEMKMYEDFAFQVKPDYLEDRTISVLFKDYEQGFICLMRWIGLNKTDL